MLIKNLTRGNKITFSTTFFDVNNNIALPDNPTVSIFYKSNNVYLTTNLAMSIANSGNNWVATWDSSNADVGIVEWHIYSGPNTGISQDGDFRVLANKANPGYGGL